METPPTRGRDVAVLQKQLDTASGQRLHRTRISRSWQMEDTFYTPKANPHELPTTARIAPIDFSNDDRKASELSGIIPDGSAASRQSQSTPGTVNSIHAGSTMAPGSSVASPRGLQNTIKSEGASQVSGSFVPPNPQLISHGSPTRPQRNRNLTTAQTLSSRKRCEKCHGDISGHFVRALGSAYHIDCFTCRDCQVPCAAKFFSVEDQPLCEHCYFKRQNLLCYRCGESLRGSYITALDRKYHIEHFTCSLCTTVFGPEDSYFEYQGDIYCRCHYSSLFAYKCEGCKSPILKQFVETYRGGKQQQWHPECYMVFKFWSVKIADRKAREISALRKKIVANSDPQKPLDPQAAQIINHEDMIDRRAMRTWVTLSGFEEVCAAEISLLVQYAVQGRFKLAYEACSRLVSHIKVLFTALDMIPSSVESPVDGSESSKDQGKEAKTLCRKVVSYMSLLSKTRDMSEQDRVEGLSRDLLNLASAIAHYLKVLIRQGLASAVKEKLLDKFLGAVGNYSQAKSTRMVSPFSTDRCLTCGKAVEDRCFRQRGRNDRLWHARPQCFQSSITGQPLTLENVSVDNGKLVEVSPNHPLVAFSYITKLEQYVILLHVALARLDLVLNNNHRSKSEANSPGPGDEPELASRETVSTPNLLSNNGYPHNRSAPPNSPPNHTDHQVAPHKSKKSSSLSSAVTTTSLHRASIILHEKAGLTLDDIRRIVASEQARISDLPKQMPPQIRRASNEPVVFFGNLNDEEYAWVRSIAQALIQPLALKYTSRDIDFVNFQAPSNAAKHGGTIWNKMGKVFQPKEQENRIFGQPLDRLVVKNGVDSNLVGGETDVTQSQHYLLRIPSFVDDCITAMRQKDMSIEGVFRKNGNIRRLREFVEKIDKNPEENGLLVDESPIQLAALLKKFLRDLPEPLLCPKLSVLWSSVASCSNLAEQIRLAQLLVSILPRPNRNLLEVLVHFLNWVSSFAQLDDETGSKMDVSNLATVFGPTLILNSEDAASISSPSKDLATMSTEFPSSSTPTAHSPAAKTSFNYVSEPVKLMINNTKLVSEVPADMIKCLRQVHGPPRKLGYAEVQDMLKR